jgi:cytochrome b
MRQDAVMSNHKTQQSKKVRPGRPQRDHGLIWDLPLRLFHWGLVIAVIGAIASAKNGFTFWHEKMGLTILGLLGFRIIWGFAGSYHARFVNFMVGPHRVVSYLKARFAGGRGHEPGHAPTGAYATLALIVVLAVMASLGTMANDDILYEGPLASYVGEFSDDATKYHHLMEKLVFLVIALHLLAMIVYRYILKISLVPAMVHGGHDASRPRPSPAVQIGGVILLLVMVAAAQSLGFLGNRFF